ncbi:tetratricopeptide repeat protein [Jonesia quinghaiensis]|uniref:tetratricopeptide repeat protein n=1 Tax=Jonesia quinghaiensis TaxID=262806 RepID=UPI000423CD0C|nr:hypothetical protein [Jonesia quinghaiensis]
MTAQLDFPNLNARIEAFIASKHFDNAIEVLDSNAAEYYDTPEFWLLTAQVYLAVEEAIAARGGGSFLRTRITREEAHDRANSAVLRVLESHPDSPQALAMYIAVLVARGAHDEALSTAYRLTDLAPDFSLGYFYVALLLSRERVTKTNLIMTQEAIDNSLRLDPHSADSLAVAAMVAVRSGNHRAAKYYLKRGLAIDSTNNLLMSLASDVRGARHVTNHLGKYYRWRLANDPFDSEARSGLRQWILTQTLESDLFILIQLTMIVLAVALPAPANAIVYALMLTCFGFVIYLRYRVISGVTDGESVREVFTEYASAKAGITLYGVAVGGAIVLSAGMLTFPPAHYLAVIMPVFAIVMFVGASLIMRARSLELTDEGAPDRRLWMYRIAMDHQITYSWPYFFAFLASIPLFSILTITDTFRPAGIILTSYGLWYLMRTGRMIFFIQRAGLRESPWTMNKHLNPSGGQTAISTTRGFFITLFAMARRIYFAFLPIAGGIGLLLDAPSGAG